MDSAGALAGSPHSSPGDEQKHVPTSGGEVLLNRGGSELWRGLGTPFPYGVHTRPLPAMVWAVNPQSQAWGLHRKSPLGWAAALSACLGGHTTGGHASGIEGM